MGGTHLAFEFDFLFIAVRSVPFRQAGLALPVLDENERQHHLYECGLSQLVSVDDGQDDT